MFLFGKISGHIRSRKGAYLLLLILISLGFLAGCFYANLITATEFGEAQAQAEQFIKEAKLNELSFRLILSEELSSFLFICFFALFLPGFIPIIFLLFKWGFSSGFFLTFLVKSFFLKGFFLGGFFLFVTLIFFLPALLFLALQCLRVNRLILHCVFQRTSPRQTVSDELLGLAVATLLALILVTLGATLKCFVLPSLCNYLFL